jgi:hypothetical protein
MELLCHGLLLNEGLELPNAAAQARLEAGARNERTL